MRALFIGALALSLIGCSHQAPPQPATASCPDANGPACDAPSAAAPPPPVRHASFRPHRARSRAKSVHRSVHKPVHAKHDRAVKTAQPLQLHRTSARLAADKPAAPRTHATQEVFANSRVPAPAPRPAASPPRTTTADASPDNSIVPKPEPQTVEQQVAAATAAAERTTVAAASQPKTNGNAEKTASGAGANTDLLVAVLVVRPTTRAVSDLTGKTIAIDDRYSASSGSVRTAIVAAGATEVEVSAGAITAINRLTNGEVPAAVVALVSADAAEAFPQIEGFRTFHVPLSPRSVKTRP